MENSMLNEMETGVIWWDGCLTSGEQQIEKKVEWRVF